MIDDESHDGEFTFSPKELAAATEFHRNFWERMPAELRQEIESLIEAGWRWTAFTLRDPEDPEIWMYIHPIKYEKAISVERAWQLKVQSGQAWRDFEG